MRKLMFLCYTMIHQAIGNKLVGGPLDIMRLKTYVLRREQDMFTTMRLQIVIHGSVNKAITQ